MISRQPVPTTLEAPAFTVSDWVLSRVTEGRYFGEGCGAGGEKGGAMEDRQEKGP